MTALTHSIKRKLSLRQLADELGNIARACKIMGYHRDTFYEVRRAFQTGGVAALVEARRAVPAPQPHRARNRGTGARLLPGPAHSRRPACLQRAAPERMGEFLGQVSRAHSNEFIVMIVDGASSHKAKDLAVPENIRLVALPAYAPEPNPQEHVWDELREKEFPNRVFNHMDAVIAQLHSGLPRLAQDHDRVRSLTAWPWIVNLKLNAH